MLIQDGRNPLIKRPHTTQQPAHALTYWPGTTFKAGCLVVEFERPHCPKACLWIDLNLNKAGFLKHVAQPVLGVPVIIVRSLVYPPHEGHL